MIQKIQRRIQHGFGAKGEKKIYPGERHSDRIGFSPAPRLNHAEPGFRAFTVTIKLTIAAAILAVGAAVGFAQSSPVSLAYVLQADALAKSKAAAVEKLAACGRDWIVLDAA